MIQKLKLPIHILLICSLSTLLLAEDKPVKPVQHDDMVYIEAASFSMGANDSYYHEGPVHTVYIDSYYIDKYEVTNGEYKKCVDAGKCKAPTSSESCTRDSYYGNEDYSDFPVIYVNFNNVKNYCDWKNKRLPTEAEWEYAARAGLKDKKYQNGDSISKSEANYFGKDTVKVGSYPPNGYGLYDMAGNVWEWVADFYGISYYRTSPENNPKGPASGPKHSLRGGSWNSNVRGFPVAYRSSYQTKNSGCTVGFRCAR